MVIFLYFLAIIIFLFILFLLIFTAKIQINIKNFELNNNGKWNLEKFKQLVNRLYKEEYSTPKQIKSAFVHDYFYVEYNFEIYIYWTRFFKIKLVEISNKTLKIFGINFDKEKILQKFKFEEIKIEEGIDLEIIINMLPKIKNIDLYTEIGTENPILSSFLVTIVNGIFLIILKKLLVKNFKKENVKYKILQSIFCENLLNISLSCIIEWKLVHIMYIFKKIKNRRVNKYGKSSNRRSNEKCYG